MGTGNMGSEVQQGWVSAGWVDGGMAGRDGLARWAGGQATCWEGLEYIDWDRAQEGSLRLKIWTLHSIISLAFDIWQLLGHMPGSPAASFNCRPASSPLDSPPTN